MFQSKSKSTWLALCLTLLTAMADSAVAQSESPIMTESPYFFIEGDDSGIETLPLKKTSARIKLNGYLAQVKITQLYRNQGNQPINATYIFPGSTHAAVNGMTMTIGERRIVAQIQEKQQAKQTFEKAKEEGKSASLLSQKRPNVFSMEVANILPGDAVEVALTYTELLSAEQGVYEFVYPAVVGPRYGGDAHTTKTETQWISNPYFAEGKQDPTNFEIQVEMQSPLPIGSLQSPSHEIVANWLDPQRVNITMTEASSANNRDFILRYRLQGDQILTGLTRFQGADENYFLLVSEPPKRVTPQLIPNRDYFFIIDVSGSMNGFPLDTAKLLMDDLLGNLGPDDRFNMLFFAGGSQVLSPRPLRATKKNIARARAMLQNQRGGGGTELYSALKRMLEMNSQEDTSRNIVLITDGYISAEDRVFRLIDKNLQRNNLFAFGIGSGVNRHLIEGVARAGRAEAFIVTDQNEASKQAFRFNQYISAPVLTNIHLEAEGVELYDMEPAQVPDLLAERPLMILGKYRHATDSASLKLKGVNGEGEHQWAFDLGEAVTGGNTLPQLWARKKLERLYVIPEKDKQAQQQAILELGLKYSLLTSRTSFVAVDETPRNSTGKATDVKQPLPLPKGVSNLAIGQPMPEPELYWLLVFGLLAWLFNKLRKPKHEISIR